MADTPDLGSGAARCKGSSPLTSTMTKPKDHSIAVANPNLLLDHSIMTGAKGDECRPISYHGRRTLLEWQRLIHANAQAKGFWHPSNGEPHVNLGEKIALVHQELSECLEHVRNLDKQPALVFIDENGKPDGVGVEIADAVIRLIDMATFLGLDIESIMLEKHEYNTTRPYKHCKRF